MWSLLSVQHFLQVFPRSPVNHWTISSHGIVADVLSTGAWQGCVGSDIIYAERRGQSQKPEEIYQLIEELVPGGESPLAGDT